MKSIAALLLSLFTFFNLPAQNKILAEQGGIFLTWQDYQSNNLSILCNCNSSSDKIILHHFFSKNYVDVIKGNEKIRLSKDSIYGYRDCKRSDYRFYKEYDKEYRIEENKSIVIYSALKSVLSSTGKTSEFVPHYFFSTSLNSEIFSLSILNLKRAFPDTIKFHDMLDVTFGDGSSISMYDHEHGMYKVNYLLSKLVTTQNQ